MRSDVPEHLVLHPPDLQDRARPERGAAAHGPPVHGDQNAAASVFVAAFFFVAAFVASPNVSSVAASALGLVVS